MPEYVNDDKRRAIRAEALERATQLAISADSWTDEGVISLAKKFEDYLRNGKTEPAVRSEPEPGRPRTNMGSLPPLIRPRWAK